MARQMPDGDALPGVPEPVRVFVRDRFGRLDQRLAAQATKVAALEQEVKGMLASLTALSAAIIQRSKDNGGPVRAQDDVPEAQRDWLAVTGAAEALAWLQDAEQFLRRVWPALSRQSVADCWYQHPVVVIEVLAVAAQRDWAYAQPEPTGVSDLLNRWVPAAADRIRPALKDCHDGLHRPDPANPGVAYRVAQDALDAYAAWWVGGRRGVPPGLARPQAA